MLRAVDQTVAHRTRSDPPTMRFDTGERAAVLLGARDSSYLASYGGLMGTHVGNVG